MRAKRSGVRSWPQDAEELLLLGDVGLAEEVAGRLGDVEAALLVEGGGDGPLDQRRPGDEFDLEARRQREGVAVQLGLLRVGFRLDRDQRPRSRDQDDQTN